MDLKIAALKLMTVFLQCAWYTLKAVAFKVEAVRRILFLMANKFPQLRLYLKCCPLTSDNVLFRCNSLSDVAVGA